MAWTSREDVKRWFRPRGLKHDESVKLTQIRARAEELAELILDSTPGSADQSAAMRYLRLCVSSARDAMVCSKPQVEARKST